MNPCLAQGINEGIYRGIRSLDIPETVYPNDTSTLTASRYTIAEFSEFPFIVVNLEGFFTF